MTRRDFYNAVINANFNDDATEFAKAEIAKLDATNEKRKSTPSKTAVANEPIKANIVKLLNEHGTMCAADVGGMLEITTQKASALLRQLVEAEALVAEEKKVPKKGAVKFYSVK